MNQPSCLWVYWLLLWGGSYLTNYLLAYISSSNLLAPRHTVDSQGGAVEWDVYTLCTTLLVFHTYNVLYYMVFVDGFSFS